MKNRTIRTSKPPWLRRRLPSGPEYEKVRTLIRSGDLHTVCQEAKCPNQFECFSSRTATFLILGSQCTRSCGFCNIELGDAGPPDPDEPDRVARAAEKMKLRYVVVTSVTRDDLPDGGAGMFARTIGCLKERIPDVQVEVLIPDFRGDESALAIVLEAGPEVLNHNLETVKRLYPVVRPEADYQRSLDLIAAVGRMSPSIPAKSGLMMGLGETLAEVQEAILDLYRAGCRILTLGQYLQPSSRHLPVSRFVPPEEFDGLRQFAEKTGFDKVASGPFVRSSYHAGELFKT